MLIVASLLKPEASALLPRQHHVQYRWLRCPRRDGSVNHVVLASSSLALVWGAELFSAVSLVKKY
jgi:hypothetical protein